MENLLQEEEKIRLGLLGRFPFLENKVSVKRSRRISAQVPSENFLEVFAYAIKEMKFEILSALTGMDEGETFGFIYHLATDKGIVINLKINIPRQNPVLKTVTETFPAAEIYEREIADLLGITIQGLKPGKRYPLPDEWPTGEYPLRKDWKPKTTDTIIPPTEDPSCKNMDEGSSGRD